jgi:Holliday junction resolvase RusA-like endonuclease
VGVEADKLALGAIPSKTGRFQTLCLILDHRMVSRLSPNARAQSHWPRTNARDYVMRQTRLTSRISGLRRMTEPVSVTFRWVVPDRRKRDIDNLAGNGTVKAVLDALVESQYLADDSTRYVVEVKTVVAYMRGCRQLEVTLEEV